MKIIGLRKKSEQFVDRIDSGFTFVETLAVLAVTAVLASEAGVAAFSLVQKAKVAAARTQIEVFRAALQTYYVDNGYFPTEEQGLEALWKMPDLYPVPENWSGPYTDKSIPKDPWGTDYKYVTKNSVELVSLGAPPGLPFGIISYGADKSQGGEKNDQDIVSWN